MNIAKLVWGGVCLIGLGLPCGVIAVDQPIRQELVDPECSVVDIVTLEGRIIDVQPGDIFYLTASGPEGDRGVTVDLDNGEYGMVVHTGDRLPVGYFNPGHYRITAAVEGRHLAQIRVNVIAPPKDLDKNSKPPSSGITTMTVTTLSTSIGGSVGSVYAGDYPDTATGVGKYPVRIVVGAAGTFTLTKYGGGWSQSWSFDAAGETNDVIDGPKTGQSAWTLIKSGGGTHVLSPNSPYKLKINNIWMYSGPAYVGQPGAKLATSNIYLAVDTPLVLGVEPGPGWASNNTPRTDQLYEWKVDSGSQGFAVSKSFSFSTPGTYIVSVECKSPSTTPIIQSLMITVLKVDLVPVQVGEDGKPIVIDGVPQVGAPIDLENEGVCTYAPDGGSERGELTLETSLDGGGQWVSLEVSGDTAELTMTYGSKELFTAWALTRIPGTELFTRYQLLDDPDRTVIADLYWSDPPTTTTDLKVKLKDESFTGSTSEFDLSYYVFLPDTGASFYSNYKVTGPPQDIGYPLFSQRNVYALMVSAGGATLDFGSAFAAEVEDDYETHTLTMTQTDDGSYVSEIIVPILEVDDGEDLGLEGIEPVTVVKYNNNADPSFSETRFTINHWVSGSAMQIAKGKTKVDQAMLMSALMSNEDLGTSRGSQGVNGAGEVAVTQLGYGVTPLFSPTKDKINLHLKSHRTWIHSGHGHHVAGIDIVQEVGTRHKLAKLKAADITAANLDYRLVFMNTCDSTDKHHEYDGTLGSWVLKETYTTTAVMDIGTKLNAKNYVGWDCWVSRKLSVYIPKMLLQRLDKMYSPGGGVLPTVNDAVLKTKADASTMTDGYYAPMLRCVKSDSGKFDLKQ